MGRPSVTEQRAEQILDAFEICVARYGVEGSTLEKIAEQAGLARALLRHHVGNRDDLLDALVNRFLERSDQQTELLVAALPSKHRARTLIEFLFDPAYDNSTMIMVASALIIAANDRPQLAERLRHWVTAFITMVTNELALEYPDSKADAIEAVASGVVGIYFNVDALMPLGKLPVLRNASRQAALRLLTTLEK